jgi:hypothetical protein
MMFFCAAVFGVLLFHIDSRFAEDGRRELDHTL